MSTDHTVFVVDGHAAHRKKILERISKMGLPAEGFESGEQFLRCYDDRRGCLLVEVQLPGMSGLQLQERLAASGIGLPVVIMAAQPDVTMAVRAMKAGAIDFLQKPCHDLPLWESIQTALELDAFRRRDETFRADVRQRLAQLTREEQQVLELLLEGKPNKSIAALLDVSLRTVDFRRASVLRKMRAGTLVELTRLVVAADPSVDVRVLTRTKPAANGWATGSGDKLYVSPAASP